MQKILVYDGDCPMCWWISQRFVAVGLVEDGQRRPYQSFEGERARSMEAAGIRNEMLVLEPESGEIRSGIRGFLWLLEDTRYRLLGRLLGLGPLRAILRLVYRTIAYNRRVLAPPSRGIVCDCDPDPHPGFRALFLAVLSAAALGSATLVGVAVEHAFGVVGVLPAVAGVVLLFGAQLLLGWFVLREEPYRRIGNALVIVAVASLAALPLAAVALLFEGTPARLLVVLGVTLGVLVGARSLRWRVMRSSGNPPARRQPR